MVVVQEHVVEPAVEGEAGPGYELFGIIESESASSGLPTFIITFVLGRRVSFNSIR